MYSLIAGNVNTLSMTKNKKTTNPSMLGISLVERDTGLSKDTLRVWERRYGFPLPARDESGERLYDAHQIDKLRAIKRLLDAGLRPGKLMDKSLAELNELGPRPGPTGDVAGAEPVGIDLLAMLKSHDDEGLEAQLSQRLVRQGIQNFVLQTIAPLTAAVGEAWVRGELAVFEEHHFTEQVQSVLRAAIQGMPRRRQSPRVLLTTVPNEQHGLGLLMVETLLAAEQVPCISLGTQTPLPEIVSAAAMHRADIVALSFSAGFPLRPATASVHSLRASIPAANDLWIGGALAARLRQMPAGVSCLPGLSDLTPALATWNAAHGHPRTPAR